MFQLFKRPQTDDEYIQSLRQQLRRLDRFRWWLVAFNVAVLALTLWLVYLVYEACMGIGQNGPGLLGGFGPGFGLGAVLGLAFSWRVYESLHAIGLIFSGLRAERLLVNYYDDLYPAPDDGDGLIVTEPTDSDLSEKRRH